MNSTQRFVLFILLMLVILSAPAQAEQGYFELTMEADSAYQDKNWDRAVVLYEKAFLVRNNHAPDLYNGACCVALAGDPAKARGLLILAVENGWADLDWISQDQDFASLHSDPKWAEFLENLDVLRTKYEAGLNKKLLGELREIREKDQKHRQQFAKTLHDFGADSAEVDALKAEIKSADETNLAKVLKIIEKHGWPGKSLVGPDGSQTAFLVIQHAPLEIQEQYLPLMRDAVANFELEPADLALLEDRVLTKKGEPQIFGSQVQCDPKTWKDCVLLPIADEANVNARRAQIGLGPLEEYVKQWKIEWSPPTANETLVKE